MSREPKRPRSQSSAQPAMPSAGNKVTSSGRPDPTDPDVDTRIAPDPFSIVLPALAALGAIASIAAVNWVGHERTPDQTRSKRKATNTLRDLESCCLGLTEIFRRFLRHPRLFAGEGGTISSPMKFGVHGPRITLDTSRTFQQLMNDTASMLVLASKNAFDVMAAIEDGDIEAPESVFFGFTDAQERLNQLFQSRASLKTMVEAGNFIADQLTALVRELKQHRVD